jgi:hypothetical protein
MSVKAWLLAVVLAVIALAPVFIFAYYGVRKETPDPAIASFEFGTLRPQELQVGASFEVRACRVLDGYRFEMYLEDGNWIEAHLPVATKEEASPVVVDWLKKTTPPAPTVTLRRQIASHWIVDLQLTVDGKRINIVDSLREKGLLLQIR